MDNIQKCNLFFCNTQEKKKQQQLRSNVSNFVVSRRNIGTMIQYNKNEKKKQTKTEHTTHTCTMTYCVFV